MRHTFFLQKKTPERTSSQRPYGWKWHFVVPNLSLSSRLLQATLPWLMTCCDSRPGHSLPPVLPVPLCCRSAPSSALPALELVPIPFPAAPAAPRCYRLQPQLKGRSPSSGVTVPLSGLQSQLTLLPVASGKDFFSPCTSGLTLPGAAGRFPVGAGMAAPQLPLTAPLLRTHPGRELWVSQTVQL